MKRQSNDAKRQGRVGQPLTVSVRYVTAPNADRRISRAMDILLSSAERHVISSENIVDNKTTHLAPLPFAQINPGEGDINGR